MVIFRGFNDKHVFPERCSGVDHKFFQTACHHRVGTDEGMIIRRQREFFRREIGGDEHGFKAFFLFPCRNKPFAAVADRGKSGFPLLLHPAAGSDLAAVEGTGDRRGSGKVRISYRIMVNSLIILIHKYKGVVPGTFADEFDRFILRHDRPDQTAGNGEVIQNFRNGGKLFCRVVVAGEKTEGTIQLFQAQTELDEEVLLKGLIGNIVKDHRDLLPRRTGRGKLTVFRNECSRGAAPVENISSPQFIEGFCQSYMVYAKFDRQFLVRGEFGSRRQFTGFDHLDDGEDHRLIYGTVETLQIFFDFAEVCIHNHRNRASKLYHNIPLQG